jgi:molybdopterin/thiamine biosynthesis adenylyltransferase
MNMDFERYARQLVMQQIGIEGQEKLARAKVAVAGIGGLGSFVAMQLAGMGVGNINLIDRDIVTKTDLHRQYLYTEEDMGKLKVIAAKKRLQELNSDIKIEVSDSVIDEDSAESICKDSDVVIDCLDSAWAKYSLNRACIRMKKPLVFASAVSNYAVISSIVPERTACLKCIYPNLDDGNALTCAVAGVHPSILGIAASIEVSEAVRLLLGKEPNLASKLMFIDLESLSFDMLVIKRNEKCSECSADTVKKDRLKAPFVEKSCSRDGKGTYFLNPENKIQLKMEYEDYRRTGLHKAYEDDEITIFIKGDSSAIALVRGKVFDVDIFEKNLSEKYKDIVKAFSSQSASL